MAKLEVFSHTQSDYKVILVIVCLAGPPALSRLDSPTSSKMTPICKPSDGGHARATSPPLPVSFVTAHYSPLPFDI